MQKLLLIRFALRELVLPALAGLAGMFLSIYLPLSHSFQPWQLPLLAGLLGTPLVAIGGSKDPQQTQPQKPSNSAANGPP